MFAVHFALVNAFEAGLPSFCREILTCALTTGSVVLAFLHVNTVYFFGSLSPGVNVITWG